ncbi:hypothetical protein [Paraburkholderia phenazinium]|uniref:hypothetical protein n=1 Tax=Paraburkholderia phenazinium TaxID=60549 RepID=UPI00158BB3F7|nr:hypothetical protein [Paraburkholderia phenazinium]
MSTDSEESIIASLSSAHTYRLLIFKDRLRIHHRNRTNFTYPAPLRFASLHQQQRNEIMKNLFRFVNNIFSLSLKTLLTLRPLVSAAALVRKRGGE